MSISLVGRGSKLSVTQLIYVSKLIRAKFPELDVQIHTAETSGDRLTDKPLHQYEDIGFFTKEIDQYLLTQKADIAVHCLKDVGTERPAGLKTISILDRENPRDVMIYNHKFLDKVKRGETVKIGTSSLRRHELIHRIVPDLLPHGDKAKISLQNLRGNIETRVGAVHREETDPKYCDAIIIAIAGLNRLMGAEDSRPLFRKILEDTDYMLLPATEFPGAPGQGALCLEVNVENKRAIEVARALNEKNVETQALRERELLTIYGGGCHQKFGVVNLLFQKHDILIAKGISEQGEEIDINEYYYHKRHMPNKDSVKIFDTRRFRSLVTKTNLNPDLSQIKTNKIFVSHTNAVNSPEIIEFLKGKEVWVPGISTFKHLAQKGIKVNGCCDNLGYDFLYYARQGNFFDEGEFCVLTHQDAQWESSHNLVPTYKIGIDYDAPEVQSEIEELKSSDFILWSSFFMFKSFYNFVENNTEIIHSSLIGKTEKLIKNHGITRIVTFPSLNEFDVWITT